MLGLKLKHVDKRGPKSLDSTTQDTYQCSKLWRYYAANAPGNGTESDGEIPVKDNSYDTWGLFY